MVPGQAHREPSAQARQHHRGMDESEPCCILFASQEEQRGQLSLCSPIPLSGWAAQGAEKSLT